MANISMMEALRRAMQSVKAYVDDNSIEFERDGLEIPGIIDNQYPSLETQDDTLIGAINEVYNIASDAGVSNQQVDDMLENIYGEEE